jgi:hypothetical protein
MKQQKYINLKAKQSLYSYLYEIRNKMSLNNNEKNFCN